MTTLSDFDLRAKRFAEARETIATIVQGLNEGIEAMKRDQMKPLRAAIRAAAEHHDKLKAMIGANPELFKRPRSVVLHGIKLGFRKGTGGLEFEDEAQVVKLIRRHFPDQFDLLVKTTEKPVKKTLGGLTVAELKKLGVTVEETGDVVFVKPTDSAVDKLVNQLLESATEETEQT